MIACEIGAENCHESTLEDEELKGKRREEGAAFLERKKSVFVNID